MKMKRIEGLLRNKHFKSFSTLAVGTVSSQILLVAASPLLTRLFTPQDFGVLSAFTSIAVICSIVFSGRYELAVGLPESEAKAVAIMQLVRKLSVISSVLLFIAVFIFWGCHYLGYIRQDLFSFSYLLLPVYNFLVINNSSLIYWVNRHKEYGKVSLSSLFSAIFNILISVLLGFLGVNSFGLVLGLVAGMLASVVFFYIHYLKQIPKEKVSTTEINLVAKEYIFFPKYTLFSDLAFNLNQQFLPLVFTVFYSNHIVGLFSLANRMLRLPNIVFTTAIANIFRNEAIDHIRVKGNCQVLFKATFKKLVFIGLIVYSSIFILSPYLFVFFFGAQWETSAIYAQILCVMLFVEFFTQPFNSLYYVCNNQKTFLKLQSLQTFFSIGIVVVLSVLKKDVLIILKTYSFISIMFSFTNLYFTFKLSQVQNGS
jgi:O-antigen/teichoic acid export membrane protein